MLLPKTPKTISPSSLEIKVKSYFNSDGMHIERLGAVDGDGLTNHVDTREKLFAYDFQEYSFNK